VTAFEVAGLPLLQVSLEVSLTVIISPLAGVKEYMELFVPTAEAPLYHWYVGEPPPLTGVAVKVTAVPVQMLLAEGTIETLTGRTGLTVIVMAFEVAGLPLIQVSPEVITTVITSPLTGVYEYVVLFEPTGVDP
jgi:hypothetical protein